jgi:hypothetical protein
MQAESDLLNGTKYEGIPYQTRWAEVSRRSLHNEHTDGIQTLDLFLNEHSDEHSLASLHVPKFISSPPQVSTVSRIQYSRTKRFSAVCQGWGKFWPYFAYFLGPLSPFPLADADSFLQLNKTV